MKDRWEREKKVLAPHPSFPHSPIPSQGHGGGVHHFTVGLSRQREACGEKRGEEERAGSIIEGEKEILDSSEYAWACSLASYLQSHLELTCCKGNVVFYFSIVKESEHVNHSVMSYSLWPQGF